MTSDWAEAEANAFWALLGGAPPFPRDLTNLLPLALPLAVVVLPGLALARIERWLADRATPYRFPCADRRLRGCLVAYAGSGLLFVDGADAVDERRFTVAHEAAHFLIDYLRPRTAAIAALGPGVIDALDGRRSPTRTERIDATLAGCPVGVHVHLLERAGAADVVEKRADRLACELLAPGAELARRFRVTSDSGRLDVALIEDYGLPLVPATAYSARLRRAWRPSPTFVEWLRP